MLIALALQVKIPDWDITRDPRLVTTVWVAPSEPPEGPCSEGLGSAQ